MGEIIHSSLHMLDYLLFKKVEILLLVVKLFQLYRKLLRSDSVPEYKPTWPFVISIKARKKKKKKKRENILQPRNPWRAGDPSLVVLGPDYSKRAAGNRKGPAMSVMPVPFETKGGRQLTGRCNMLATLHLTLPQYGTAEVWWTYLT